MFGIFKKNDYDDRSYDDRLVVYDDEHQTVEIHYVDEVKDGQVKVIGHHIVPMQDCHIANGNVHGDIVRVYMYNAPSESIQTTANLAALEQSIVLQQITDYTDPLEHQQGMDWTKVGLFALLGIAIIFGMGSCGASF